MLMYYLGVIVPLNMTFFLVAYHAGHTFVAYHAGKAPRYRSLIIYLVAQATPYLLLAYSHIVD